MADEKKCFYLIEWMDMLYLTLSMPNPTLEKVLNKVNEKLSVLVKGQFDKSNRKQILLSLLGSHFLRQYFPNERYEEKYLLAPHMDLATRHELTDDVHFWLLEQLKKIELQLGINQRADGEIKDPDVSAFLTQIRTTFQSMLDARIEELKKIKEKDKHLCRVDFDTDSHMHALGEGLLAIGLKDTFKMAQILKTWQQRCFPLPSRLRIHIWEEFLFFKHGIQENIAMTETISDFRIRFTQTANRNVNELKLESYARSTIHKEIKDAVEELYHQNHSLRNLNSDSHIALTCSILNAVHVANGTFNPLYVYWVCPIQLVFANELVDEEESVMNMAMHLDLLVRYCPLTQSEVFSLAKQVLASLKKFDPFLHEHLYDVAAKKIKINAKDFPVECLHQDKTEANKISSELPLFAGKELPADRLKLFENPEIFVRKWLITVFVSAFSPVMFLLTWDYIFLGKWQRKRFHDYCIVLLGLLKNWFYRAKDHRGLKQVFFEEPSRLYTNDFRRAWLHWQDGGSFEIIPEMNSNLRSATTPINDGGDLAMATLPKITPSKSSNSDIDLENELSIPDIYLRTRRQSSFFPEGVSAWVPFNSDTLKSLPVSEGISEAFDLYIDSIRFVPDCASLVKITGKVHNLDLGQNEDEKFADYDFMTLTDLTTSYRNPEFRYRITINEKARLMNPESIVVFQIYTIERTTRLMMLLGSVLMPLFDTAHKKPLLKFGGHQLRLRLGMPKNIKLFQDWLERSEPIPAASLLIRILPQSDEYLNAPEYDSGYYLSETTRPTISEWNLFKHYLFADDLLMTVKQIAIKLLRDERHIGIVTDDELMKWIELKFENKPGQIVKNTDFSKFVYYGIRSGMRMQIKQAHCLPEHQDNNYIQVLVRLLPGNNTKKIKPTHEGWGSDDKFTTKLVNFNSYLRSPAWDDQASLMHPFLDNNSMLLIELFGLEIVYERDPMGISYGKISSKSGSNLKINLDFPLAWTVVRLFNKGFVNSGLHVYPLFKGKISKEIISKLQYLSVEKVLKDSILNEKLLLNDGAVIEFAMWDGNFIDSEHAPLLRRTEILELCGIKPQDKQNYIMPKSAHKLSSFVSSVMSVTELSASKKREMYNREKDLFQELILKHFAILMNAALKKEGLSKLNDK